MRIKNSGQPGLQPRGFTLVEILMVITIIAILTGITTMVIGNVLNAGREKQTRATIKKIDGLVKDRLRAFRIAKEKGRFDGDVKQVYLNWSNPPSYKKDLAAVCVYKHYLGKYFGVDLLLDPTLYNDGSSNPVATDEEKKAFSAEILYEILTRGTLLNQNPVPLLSITAPELDFSSSEVADTDGDGRLEFVDGWGEPIRFYLWPTRLTKPDGTNLIAGNLFLRLLIPAAADKTDDSLNRDQDDPKGVLFRADDSDTNNGTSYISYLNSRSFFYTIDQSLATPTPHLFDTYHAFLIVSAGQDRTLGTLEPLASSSGGSILAEPVADINTSQTDSSQPDHVYNSVMNDDITNYQGPGGS